MSNNNVETKEKREKYTVAKGKTSTSPFPPFPVRKVHCFINVRTKSEDMCALVLTVVLSGYFSQWTYWQQQFSSFSLPKNIMHFSSFLFCVMLLFYICLYSTTICEGMHLSYFLFWVKCVDSGSSPLLFILLFSSGKFHTKGEKKSLSQ